MSNPFDAFDTAAPAVNPFDAFDTAPRPFGAKAADAAKLAVRGATSEGLYYGVEGATRMASNSPVQHGIERVQDFLTEKIQGFPLTDEQKATRRKLRGQADEETGSAAFDRGLRWYADAVHDTRDKIKKGLPVAPDSEQALWGQVAQGVGQAIGTLPTYAIPGFGPATTVGQLYQQGYEDAKEHGADDVVAHDAGIKNVPAAALEYLSDKIMIGRLLKPMKGKLTVRELLKGLAVTAASEGSTEGAQQAWQNYVASSLSGFDPDRKLDDGVINAAVVGATVGGLVGGAGPLLSEGTRRFEERDTGQNKPERPVDLKAQQQQLVTGDRAVQMFPLGTKELDLPPGMQRVETPRGTFHFDPRRMTADEILSASKKGKENELLGLGPFDKAEVMKRAAAGEPVAVVTERGPNGEELRGALATPSTMAATTAALEAGKSETSTVKVEPLKETLAQRDVADQIEASLPDGESKDYLRGRTKEDLKRQAATEVDLPALWKGTVDAVLKTGVSPKEFSAIDRTLELLNDKEGRKKAGLRAKVTPDRITSLLGNTVLDGALRGSDFTRLVTALAQSPANVDALRAEFAAAREGLPADLPPAPGPVPEVANTTPEPSPAPAMVQPRQRGELPRMGDEVDRLVRRQKLREQIAAEAAAEKTKADELATKKATAEQALKDAAAKRQAESARLAAIDKTGRDPESGLIADLRKVPTRELENFDWDKDRYMHGGDEVKTEDIDAVLSKRFADEERAAAGENAAGYTLLGLLKGKPDELRAAGLRSPLRLMSPKEARERGSLGGEHAALRERTGGFAYFTRDGLVEDGLEEQLRELGFDVPDVTAAYHLVERAMNGEEITPAQREQSQVQFARRQNPQEGTPAFATWFRQSKVLDESGKPLVVYHGSKRADRINDRFRKNRATSGPMAFFTANPEIASNYATGKEDTSLVTPDDYSGWFKYKDKSMRSPVSIDRAWWMLTPEQRQQINQRIYSVGYENHGEGSGPIVGNSESIMGRDSIDYELRQARGNGLRALVEIWLNSGSLFNDERTFLDVLSAAGLDMSKVEFDSPWTTRSGVFPVYLSIQNPLNTGAIPAEVVTALEQAGKRKRAKEAAGGNPDAWDKNSISGRDWTTALKEDIQNGTSHAWTRIPDWVTETLQRFGYDGIEDTGGKMGGEKHAVWIPFDESQVKSATGNRGTFDPNNPKITFARREHKRDQQIEALADQWWRSMDKIAPGLSKEAELRLTNADDFVEQGLARRDELTGQEEAARVRDFAAKREIFYLFQHALRKNTADMTRLNLQHEMAHAFWDTLDRTTQRQLHELFAREIETKTGPLYDANGDLRDNVALGATEDIQEWFAERLAHANDSWAQRRIETAARGNTLISTVAAQFRQLLLKMRELIERHLKLDGYDDGLLTDFRQFLDQGTRWNDEPSPAQEPAPAFSRRAKDDAEFDAALRTFDKLDRERYAQLEKYGKTDRDLLERLSEARMVLENSWPGWNEDLKERRAEQDANATVPPEPEAGVSADDDVREIDPQATAWKRSRLEASSFRPPGKIGEWLAGIGNLFKNFRSAIPELPAGAAGREFTRFKQGFRMLKAATETVRHEAEQRIGHVLEPITALGREGIAPNEYRRLINVQAAIKALNDATKPVPAKLHAELAALESKLDSLPYHLFRKTVLYRDLWFRAKILNASGEPITLPMNLTREEVEGALRELHAKIAASPDRAAIEESLKRHYALVKSTRDDLLARGYIIPEELRNPLYFPHLMLEKFSGRLQSVKLDTAEDFRSYLQQLTGSAKDIETDYLTAMYYHMGQVMAHNARQDIVTDYWQPYDIRPELEEEAKALNAKRAEEGLGPLHWRQLVGKDHVIYTVDDRIPLRPEYIINRQVLADRLGVELGEGDLQAQLRELGLNVTLTAADFQAAMAAGEKQQWVLPRPVAAALDGILERETQSRSLLSRVLSSPQNLWKRWILYAPHNVVRYTYGNLVADLEKLFSADPAVFGHLLPAYREVRQFIAGGEASPDLKEAFRRGVIQSVTAAEVTDLANAERFEVFLTSPAKLLNNIARGVQWGRTVNELREASFRYAKFKADLERMRNGDQPVYAGAYHRDVEAITDSKPGANDAIFAKAAEIARKTFVDYGDMSVSGDGLRRYVMPFYSWMEGNFKYHANLFRNLGDMSVGAGMSQVARGGMVATSKVLLPRSAAGVLLRLALPYVAVSLWNNSGDREELEKTLSAEDRRRFHIILGKDNQGRTLVTYAPTALSDVAGWFGGNDFARLAGDYWRGTITLPQAVHEWFSNTPGDVLNKAVQGISPQLKAVYIAASRRNPFPDVFDQRSISDHDLSWAVLGSMTDGATGELVRRLVDKTYYSGRDFGDWAQQLILQARRRDPEQWGYYATLDRVDEWQKAHGGTVDFGTNNKADAALLTSFRRAIRAADVPAAINFYHKLIEAGYSAERFAASVRAADPLQTLKKEHRQEFFDNLSPAEQQDVKNAYRYAQRMQAFSHHEHQLFPSQNASAAYKQRFAAAPRDQVFSGIMLDVGSRSDEDEELRADKLLHQALRKR